MYDGQDIFSITVPRSKLQVSALYEWREAARWAHYRWGEFRDLEGEEQSAIIAQYMVTRQIEAVFEHERLKAQKAANRRTGK